MKKKSNYLIPLLLLLFFFLSCSTRNSPRISSNCNEKKADLNETEETYDDVSGEMKYLFSNFQINKIGIIITETLQYRSLSSLLAGITPVFPQCQNGYMKGLRIEFGLNSKSDRVLIYEPIMLYLDKPHHHMFKVVEENKYYLNSNGSLSSILSQSKDQLTTNYTSNLKVYVNNQFQPYDPYRDVSGILFTSQEIDSLYSANVKGGTNQNGTIDSKNPLIYFIGAASEDANSAVPEQKLVISPILIKLTPTVGNPVYENRTADFGNGCKPSCSEVIIPTTN